MNNSVAEHSYFIQVQYEAERALSNLYHNATPRYPQVEESDVELFDRWFENSIRVELEFLNDLCAHDKSYGPDTAWKRISNYGKVQQWGRGGRTVAPEHFVNDTYGFGIPLISWDLYGSSISELIRLTEIVDSFNAYVGVWCQGVSERWTEYQRTETTD